MAQDPYLLKDGTYAFSSDCSTVDGVLQHSNGIHVACKEDGTPQTLMIGAVENMNVLAATGENPESPAPEPSKKAAASSDVKVEAVAVKATKKSDRY